MSSQDDISVFDESEEAHDPQLTELVAYLDGELDEDASNRLERKLASNAPLRGFADSLDKTWQLLDSLGETKASGEFTQKTLASLNAISGSEAGESGPVPLSRRLAVLKRPVLKGLLWTLAGFLSCSAGLIVSRSGGNDRQESDDIQILRKLSLLENVPRLYSVPDAEFLQEVMTLNGPSPNAAAGGKMP